MNLDDPRQPVSTNQAKASTSAASGNFYNILMGVLLLVIIVSLTMLWMRERSRRRDAEAAIATLEETHSKFKQQAGQLMLQQFGGGPDSPAGIQRGDFEPQEVTLDGKKALAIKVSAGAGRKVGLLPGDVLVVAQAATAPAGTGPAD